MSEQPLTCVSCKELERNYGEFWYGAFEEEDGSAIGRLGGVCPKCVDKLGLAVCPRCKVITTTSRIEQYGMCLGDYMKREQDSGARQTYTLAISGDCFVLSGQPAMPGS